MNAKVDLASDGKTHYHQNETEQGARCESLLMVFVSATCPICLSIWLQYQSGGDWTDNTGYEESRLNRHDKNLWSLQWESSCSRSKSNLAFPSPLVKPPPNFFGASQMLAHKTRGREIGDNGRGTKIRSRVFPDAIDIRSDQGDVSCCPRCRIARFVVVSPIM